MVNADLLGLGTVDGVRALGHWAGDAAVYWLLEAPDAAAASQYHADRQLACGDLEPIAVGLRAVGMSLTKHQSSLVCERIRELWEYGGTRAWPEAHPLVSLSRVNDRHFVDVGGVEDLMAADTNPRPTSGGSTQPYC